MTISAFDHPFLSGLVGDDETAALFGADADLSAMLAFEAALAQVCASHGLIPAQAGEEIAAACAQFEPDLEALRTTTARDGVVVPELVRQLRAAVGEGARTHVHFGATSQDVIDTSLILRVKQACTLFDFRIAALISGFDTLSQRFGDAPLTAHTRMQEAMVVRVLDRVRTWREPLSRHGERLRLLAERDFAVQFGGAAGTLDKFGDKAQDVRRDLAAALSLVDAIQFHAQRDRFAELAGVLAMITGSLGKFGQDIALMAQDGDEIVLSGGGGSSAMPHKQNPVAAEVLVSLGRFNAVQLSAMQQSMIHEQERSGAAWTLEWLILPQMVVATGAALRLASDLVGHIQRLGKTAAGL